MMMPPFAGLKALFAATQSADMPDLQKKPGAAMTALAGMGGAPKADPEQVVQFAQLLAAGRLNGASTLAPGQVQIALPGDAATRGAALADLAAETKALAASFLAEPGTPASSDVVAAFVALLQQFDAATGGDAMQVLATSLKGLDAAGLARLEEAATDPASLLEALAGLVGIPVADNPGWPARSVLVPKEGVLPVQGEPKRPAPLIMPKTREGEQVFASRDIGMQPVPATDKTAASQQTATPTETRLDVRAMVVGALTNAGASAGTEGDALPIPAPPSDARPLAASPMGASPADMARPSEAGQPPASGFARNLAQQIRSATLTEGTTRIALAPRGLGEIEIDMGPDEAGNLRIILRAENPAVLQALRGDRDGLLLALSQGGADVRDADLGFEDFSQRHRRDAEETDAPRGRSPERGIEPAAPIGTEPRRIIGAGRLDMLT
jgi:hypothetical protein